MADDAQPLVVPLDQLDKEPRQWRGPWYACCGSCEPQDVAAGALAAQAPCVAFGWNMHRGLGLSAWKEALRFFLLTVVTFAVIRGTLQAVVLAKCGHAMAHTHMDGASSQYLPHQAPFDHHHHHRNGGLGRRTDPAGGFMALSDDGPVADVQPCEKEGFVPMYPLLVDADDDDEDAPFEADARMGPLLRGHVVQSHVAVVTGPVFDAGAVDALADDNDGDNDEPQALVVTHVTTVTTTTHIMTVDAGELVGQAGSVGAAEQPCGGQGDAAEAGVSTQPGATATDGAYTYGYYATDYEEAAETQRVAKPAALDEDDMYALDLYAVDDAATVDLEGPQGESGHPTEEVYHERPEGQDMSGMRTWQQRQEQPDGSGMVRPRPHVLFGEEGDDLIEWEELAACAVRLGHVPCALLALTLAATVYAAWYAAARRTWLRERFGIPGSFREDLLLWISCPTCALAQETRTLMANNVEEGMWQGGARPACVVVFQAPPAQKVAAHDLLA